MKSLNKTRFYVEPDVIKADVASVAVVHDDKILMMQRRDNSRWTLPGGHLDDGEDPSEGAKRELKEEAGIIANKVRSLGSEKLTSFTGKKMTIHAFIYEPKQKPTFNSKNDPDKEAGVHKWVSIKDFPQDIKDNLHSPRNTVLRKIGILKSLMDSGIDLLMKGVKGASAANHKYIRKYKRGSKWVYVYVEPNGKSRTLPDEWIKAVEKLAADGSEVAMKMLEDVVEYAPGKIEELRKLHSLGSELASRHLKEMGIDPAIEEVVESMKPADSVRANLSAEDKTKVFSSMDSALSTNLFDRLNSHRTGPIGLALTALVGSDWNIARRKIMDAVNKKKTTEEMLQEFHRQLNVIDSLPASARHEVTSAGGAGNFTYNKAIELMTTKGILPEGYGTVHKRTPGSPEHEVQGVDDIRERVKRAKAERAKAERVEAEREQRELGEYIPKAEAVLSYYGKTVNDAAKITIAKNIRKFFGANFDMVKFDKFLNPDSRNSTVIKISDGFLSGLEGNSGREREISFSFDIKDSRTGAQVTGASRRIIKNSDNSIHFHNDHFRRPGNDKLEKYEGMSKGMYAGVENFMKEVTKDYPEAAKNNSTIEMGAANHGFGDSFKGSLLWAKHYFDFKNSSDLSKWKSTFTAAIDQAKIDIPSMASDLEAVKKKISSFKHPYQFVNLGIKVNRVQAGKLAKYRGSAVVAGVTHSNGLDFDFNRIFNAKEAVRNGIAGDGKIDIGEVLLIKGQDSFYGINYFNKKTPPPSVLNDFRTAYYNREGGATAGAAPASAAPAGRFTSPRVKETVERTWKPKGKSIVMNADRLRQIGSWSKEEIHEFYQKAPLTRDAKERVKQIMNSIGG